MLFRRPPPIPHGSPAERHAAVRAELDRLARDLIAFWRTRGPDPAHGGFHATLDPHGRPTEPTAKGLIQHARHLWTFSTWYARREPSPEIEAIATGLCRLLLDRFRDRDGEFFFKIAPSGDPIEVHKLLYAQSFAIYGLCAYAEVFGAAEARDAALACFRSIDARAHDPRYRGYNQAGDTRWLRPGVTKETNTHLHLLEAFTALCRLTADPTVAARLEELLAAFCDRIIQSTGYAHLEFLEDWTPHGPPVVSYGHDLETVWLLLEAATALGRPEDPQVRAAVLRLGEAAAREGFDRRLGGYFDAGVPGRGPTRRDKIWWVQAEALPGLWQLYRLTGDPVYFDRLEATLHWIRTSQVDSRDGEWFQAIGPFGLRLGRERRKGSEWKASYHSVRALVFTADWIAGAASSPAVPAP